jgi:hypothetical protein
MASEIERDLGSPSGVYMSTRFTAAARVEWPQLLLAAAHDGSDTSLAGELVERQSLVSKESAHTKTGRVIEKNVADNAETILAEGQFNLYYIRAVCLVGQEAASRTSTPSPPSIQAALSRKLA